eukprot:6479838-Alexandrium_andersonii.AAC.1
MPPRRSGPMLSASWSSPATSWQASTARLPDPRATGRLRMALAAAGVAPLLPRSTVCMDFAKRVGCGIGGCGRLSDARTSWIVASWIPELWRLLDVSGSRRA